MRLVVFVEEPSMKIVLKTILPKIIDTENIELTIVEHQGKSDLKRSISNKLRSWNEEDIRFAVVIDQDSNDCKLLKQEIRNLCVQAGRCDVLIRIVCHELEAWYLGDFDAVEAAYAIDLTKIKNKAKFRDPDVIVNAKEELNKLLPDHKQLEGAQKISKFMVVERNNSASFQVFIAGIKRIIN